MKARGGFALCLLVTFGCSTEVRDTEGRSFAVSCHDDTCSLEPSGTRESAPAPAWARAQPGRLVLACPTERADGRDCRPLLCDGDRVCSRLGGAHAECVKGLCQKPGTPLAADDRLALCLAETGAWSGSPLQRSRTALAMSCRPPCSVPAECRQIE